MLVQAQRQVLPAVKVMVNTNGVCGIFCQVSS